MIVGILVLYLVLEEMHPGFHHWVGLLHMGLIILRYVPFMGCPGTAKVTLKLKKVGKTTRWFTYDLNPIPYDYTVEVTHRFKGLDLIDRVREELWTEVHNIVQEVVIKTIPKKKKCKKAKWLSEEALQIAKKRREAKGKGESEWYTHLNAEFQRIARRDKKAFLSEQKKPLHFFKIHDNNIIIIIELYVL